MIVITTKSSTNVKPCLETAKSGDVEVSFRWHMTRFPVWYDFSQLDERDSKRATALRRARTPRPANAADPKR